MNRLLALLLLCVFAGSSVYLLIVRPKPDTGLVDYLPEDTLVVIEWDNVARAWAGWRHSPAGVKTYQPNFFKILEQLGVRDTFADDSRKAIVFLEHLAKRTFFQSLLSQKAVLAFLPDTCGQPYSSASLSRQWVLALETGPDFSPQQLQDFFGSVQSQQTTVYQGEPLVTLVLKEGHSLSYWRQRDIVLCAQEVTLVQRCINQSLQRMVRPRSGLQLNAAYQRLRLHGRNRADVFCYADLEALQHRLPVLQEIDAESGGFMPRQLALFHFGEADKYRLGIAALADKEAVTAFTARYQLAPPAAGSAPRPILGKTGFSFWTNWFKPRELWQLGLQRADPDVVALMTSVGQQLTEITGKSLDAFFDVFGNGFGVFIHEQAVPHQSNRSLGCLILEMRDRPAVASMVKQLVAGLQVVTVKSGEMEISSVVLAGGLLQPAFALVGKYLILADSVDLIEQAWQQVRPDPDDGAKERHPVDRAAGNLFFFVRIGEMIDRLVPLLTSLAKETGERTRVMPAESRLFVREIGLPVLASLRNMATGNFRGSVAGDTILLEGDYTLSRE